MEHSQQKMETISVKILLNSDGSSAHLLSVNGKNFTEFRRKGCSKCTLQTCVVQSKI